MRYRIIIEYSGKNYSGWQRQQNGVGIQQVIEDALADLLGHKVTVIGSGRTDGGVHAAAQTAHFDADTPIPPDKIVFALNVRLPEDVKIKECGQVDSDFHSQYGAKRKTYRYQTYISRTASPLRDDFYQQVIPSVDVAKIRRCAEKLVGEHDFKAFSSADTEKKTTVRKIYSLSVTERGDELIFEIEGNGFLYNMVRIIVGTLIFIGKGMLPEDTVERMLESGDRTIGGKTFPAKGLCLVGVVYDNVGNSEKNGGN